MTRYKALEIFSDHTQEIKIACQKNMGDKLKKVPSVNLSKAHTPNHLWVMVNLKELQIEQIQNNYNPTLKAIENMQRPKKEGGITDADIQRAKEVPIENFLKVTGRGNVSCPFHDDKNPSMSIKNNRFKCFSCQRSGDVIDLYMETRGISFLEAVKELI